MNAQRNLFLGALARLADDIITMRTVSPSDVLDPRVIDYNCEMVAENARVLSTCYWSNPFMCGDGRRFATLDKATDHCNWVHDRCGIVLGVEDMRS